MSGVTKWNVEGTLPWTKGCFVCGEGNERGFRLRSRVEGQLVCLDYVTRDCDLGWKSAVHGGLTMTLLDEVMTWAAIIETGSACVSAEMTTRMKKPVAVGLKIRVEGWVAESRKKVVLTEGRMLDGAGTVLASSTGKYMQMPGDQFRICADDFVADGLSIRPGDVIRGAAG